MSCTAPSSAKGLVVFDDESLSSFCFCCPTPHEAGEGPAVCFWHSHAPNWGSKRLCDQCTWLYTEGHSLHYSLGLLCTDSAIFQLQSCVKEKECVICFVSDCVVVRHVLFVFGFQNKPYEWCLLNFKLAQMKNDLELKYLTGKLHLQKTNFI